ncbi:cation:proton antiporter [Dietzia cinnamea]|uniref:cation:proton antiporter n=1 Tax=Dietzia cinnamea TaxID=321318 RepID=UPI00223C0B13|nr:cation:proton antiporter [Dietzia cinnamea]MCT1638662.1 cation:proton antiporter [Dietzia cinnamea]MCT2060428.1 cation:proton antiporter [Dietzia cinnamea]MCT2172843.1 cation:proton antiporter [Dietzia cinnamea]MCT2234757.1 cation:proton antiporter [Dietzia cinnamea]MCT2300842.1 cation:proton antiporter [Dietzia cinnamea]
MTTTLLAAEPSSTELVSLFWIVLAVWVAPLLSGLTRSLVPGVVLLLIGGMLIGPDGLGLAAESGGVALLAEIGLGLLFLLAGFELEVSSLTGRPGRRAVLSWLVGVALATGVGWLVSGRWETAVAIGLLLTSTAIGTLLPILKGAGHDTTPVGRAVLTHGAIGELGPVLVMALLLGTRDVVSSAVAVGLFVVAALLILAVPARLLHIPALGRAMIRGTTSTSQLAMRTVILLLASMMVVATVFGLDVVLGAFAAGMILRRLVAGFDVRMPRPAGGPADGPHRDLSEVLLSQLETVGYTVFIPVFFVVSGMGISVGAVADAPWLLLSAVASMLILRGGGVWLGEAALHAHPDLVSPRDRARVGLYAATGLPIIVAVTQVAVANDLMTAEIASVLVAAGAVTVLAFPVLAEVVRAGDGRRVTARG